MNSVKLLGITMMAVGLMGCGDSGVISKISVSTFTDEGSDAWVDMSADLNLGRLSFPALSIPITNPNNPASVLGQVSLQRSSSATNSLHLQLNLTEVSHERLSLNNRLPNGHLIPVGGVDNVFGIRAGSRSTVYVGTSGSKVMLGVALVIPELRSIGSILPGVDLFLDLPKGSKVSGVGGIFTSSQADQNGLGIFFETNGSGAVEMSAMRLAAASFSEKMSVAPSKITFLRQDNSKLRNALFDKAMRGGKLSVK